MQSLEKDFYFDTMPNFIKRKHPKKGREKETRGKHQSPGKQAAQTKSYCLDWDAIVYVQILNTTYFEFFFVVA